MTSTDRLAEPAASEARRLAAEADGLADMVVARDDANELLRAQVRQQAAEIERLRARIAELESHAAVTFGTLERPTEDGPTRYTHNAPPSAPPHDE